VPPVFPDIEYSLEGRIAKALGMPMDPPGSEELERALVDTLGSDNIKRIERFFEALTPFAKGVPEVKDIFEAATGRNVFTGAQLLWKDRGLAAFGVLTFGLGTDVIQLTERLAGLRPETEGAEALEQLAARARTASGEIQNETRVLQSGAAREERKLLSWDAPAPAAATGEPRALLPAPARDEPKLLGWDASERRLLPEIRSSYGPVTPTPGITVTLIGNYYPDLQRTIWVLEYPHTTDFGPKPGWYNMLNVPPHLEAAAAKIGPDEFWLRYNKPFLDAAIARGDRIALLTKPGSDARFWTNSEYLRDYGREIKYMIEKGFVLDIVTHEFRRLW
jgi:hypothetical protein